LLILLSRSEFSLNILRVKSSMSKL
jgi:hypothetical protein